MTKNSFISSLASRNVCCSDFSEKSGKIEISVIFQKTTTSYVYLNLEIGCNKISRVDQTLQPYVAPCMVPWKP